MEFDELLADEETGEKVVEDRPLFMVRPPPPNALRALGERRADKSGFEAPVGTTSYKEHLAAMGEMPIGALVEFYHDDSWWSGLFLGMGAVAAQVGLRWESIPTEELGEDGRPMGGHELLNKELAAALVSGTREFRLEELRSMSKDWRGGLAMREDHRLPENSYIHAAGAFFRPNDGDEGAPPPKEGPNFMLCYEVAEWNDLAQYEQPIVSAKFVRARWSFDVHAELWRHDDQLCLPKEIYEEMDE